MTRMLAWLAGIAARTLEADECEAVCGDLAETRATAAQILHEILGLVVRRQAAVWKVWGPWLALLGVAIPIGVLLSVVSRNWSDAIALDAHTYADHWTWYVFRSPGARLDLAQVVVRFVLTSVTLLVWSWSVGFAIGSLSRRASWIGGVVFCALIFAGTAGSTTAARAFNNRVFSSIPFGVLFPIIVRADVVVFPALCGLRQGARLVTFSFRHTIWWTLAIAALTLWASPGVKGAIAYGWLPADYAWPGTRITGAGGGVTGFLPLLMGWPAGYLAVTAWRRHRAGISGVSG